MVKFLSFFIHIHIYTYFPRQAVYATLKPSQICLVNYRPNPPRQMVVAKWTVIYHDVSMKGHGKVHLHAPFIQAQNSLKHKLNQSPTWQY